MVNKRKLKEFLDGKWDVTFEQIIKELKINKDEYEKIKIFLRELENEGWIKKSFCRDHKIEEYDPGLKQENH